MPRNRAGARKREAAAPVIESSNVTPAPSPTSTITSGVSALNIEKPHKRDIVSEFDYYFGNVSNLANWQMFCRDVGVEDDLRSITQCRKALHGVWVNIYDLIDAKNAGSLPQRFPTQKALSQYTISTRRIFPKKRAKEGGPVKALLAHIFH